MTFEFTPNGKHYSFTKWLRIIIVFVFFVFITWDVFQKDWNALFIDLPWLIVVIQSNKITDLEDQVEKLKGE